MEIIARGRALPIRSMNLIEATAAIEKSIQRIAPVYGARKRVPSDVLEACLEIVTDHFAGIGIEEIEQAYRLWAAGRIAALEMYGGEFNATQFGRVLRSYMDYRREIRYAIAAAESQAAEAQRREERERRHADQYRRTVAEFPQTVAYAIENNRFDRPDQIPVTWYTLAEKHDLIEYAEGEKLAICKQAEIDVLAEQKAERARMMSYQSLQSLKAHHERVGLGPIFTRAQQYAVWVKVLGRDLEIIAE